MKIPLFEVVNYSQAKPVFEQEDLEGKKNLYMSGVFIQGDVKNLNERIYPVSEIRRAVGNVNKMLDEGSIFGQLDHPEELNINTDRVSHMITQMWMEGPNGMGKLKIVPTPMGNIVKTLIEAGGRLGVSSRGSGNVDERGHVSDFEIVTIDIVARPSAPNAYPRPVFESLNSKKGKLIETLAYDMQHDPKAKKELRKTLLEWVEKLKA